MSGTQSFGSNALITGDGKRIKTPAGLPAASKVLQVNADGTSEHVAAVLESQRNVANGFAGLNDDGHFVGPVRSRTGTAAEIDAIVLEPGEVAYVTDEQETRLGDGVTSGGKLYASEWRYWVINQNSAGNGLILSVPLKHEAAYELEIAGRVTDEAKVTVTMTNANGSVFNNFSLATTDITSSYTTGATTVVDHQLSSIGGFGSESWSFESASGSSREFLMKRTFHSSYDAVVGTPHPPLTVSSPNTHTGGQIPGLMLKLRRTPFNLIQVV